MTVLADIYKLHKYYNYGKMNFAFLSYLSYKRGNQLIYFSDYQISA